MTPFTVRFCVKLVVEKALNDEIHPKVGAAYSVEKIADALAHLESGKSTGKVIVNW